MVNVSNAITTEYSYQQVDSSVSKPSADYKNSVMTGIVNSSEGYDSNLNYSEVKTRLVELAKKYNLNLEEIFKCQIENLDDKSCERIIKSIEAALNDLSNSKNGKINNKQLGELAQKYNIGLLTGWSIEGFRNAQNGKQESIQERLKRAVSADSVEEALDKYYNEYFEKNIEKKLANVTDPAEREKIIKKEQLRQLQDFGRLLANTSEEERAIFVQAAKSLYADNRLPGLKAAFETLNIEQKTEEANKISAEWIVELAQKVDQFGNVSESEEIQGISRLVNKYKDANHSKEFWDDTFKTIEEFNQAYDDLKQKKANGQISEEEEKLLQKYEIYKNVISGGTVGTAENKIISNNEKVIILKDINTKTEAISSDFYKETLDKIVEYVENNENSLDISRDNFDKILTESFGDKYTEAVNNYQKETEQKVLENSSNSELGFSIKQPIINNTRVEELKQEIITTSNKDSYFIIENKNNKQEANKLTSAEVYTLKNNAFRSAANIVTYLKETGESKFTFATDVFKKFGEMGSTTQNWAMNYFSNASSTVQNLFLNKITGSVEGMVAAAKEVDLSKFNLIGVSVTTQKQIDKIEEQRV